MKTYPVWQQDIEKAFWVVKEWLASYRRIYDAKSAKLVESDIRGKDGYLTIEFPYNDEDEFTYERLAEIFPYLFSFAFAESGDFSGNMKSSNDLNDLNLVATLEGISFNTRPFYQLFQEGNEIDDDTREGLTGMPLDIQIGFSFVSIGYPESDEDDYNDDDDDDDGYDDDDDDN